jgi:hypothetical protein
VPFHLSLTAISEQDYRWAWQSLGSCPVGSESYSTFAAPWVGSDSNELGQARMGNPRDAGRIRLHNLGACSLDYGVYSEKNCGLANRFCDPTTVSIHFLEDIPVLKT